MINLIIADDNQDLSSMIEVFLKNQRDHEFKIKRVIDGEQCINELKKTAQKDMEYDVLLLDLFMPNKDGFYVIDNLKNIKFIKKPRVIVFTGNKSDITIHELLNKGVDYILLKPFDLNVLMDRIIQYANIKDEETENNIIFSNSKNSNDKNINTSDIDSYIYSLLNSSNILPNLKGYRYISDAIKLCVEDETRLSNVVKGIYLELAENYSTTSSSIERSIRNCILKAWEDDQLKGFCNFVGISVPNKKLSNATFLSYALITYKKDK